MLNKEGHAIRFRVQQSTAAGNPANKALQRTRQSRAADICR
jgi:hypothetical protein